MRRPISTMSARNASSALFISRANPNPARRSLHVSVGRRKTVERLPSLATFWAFGRDFDEPAPDFGGALQILFAERANDTHVQQRLRMLRIYAQRMLELLDSQVGLIVVVVAHAQIRADTHIFRIEGKRLRVPLDRIGIPSRVVVQVSKLRARDGVLWIAIHDVAERLYLRVVEYGRLRCSRNGSGRRR